MRRYLALAGDLAWVAISAVLAVLIRDNLIAYESHFWAVLPYMAITVAVAIPVFVIAGLHNRLWGYTALADVFQIIGAATIVILAALSISFVSSRLEGVARSVPVIQWFLVVGGLLGFRMLARIWHEYKSRDRTVPADASVEHVLLVGVNQLTELYLRSIEQYSSKSIEIVGILSDVRELKGRTLRVCKVLGTPEELQRVLDQLEVHGVTVDRIVVMQAFDELSRHAAEALSAVERGSDIKVEWLFEQLGLTPRDRPSPSSASLPAGTEAPKPLASPMELSEVGSGRFWRLKRAIDLFSALFLAIALAPLFLIVSLLVAIDVGFPLVFWQKRPGRFARPFRLYKFSTMHAAHNSEGRRISDEKRLSPIGRGLRRTRLDELPQLYNILIGEMSFIGPRPLLPLDQPEDSELRLSVRPGLTGLAQVHGERDMPVEDKNALDIWYVRNASLALDIRIVVRTIVVFWRGERVDLRMLRTARAGLKRWEDVQRADDARAEIVIRRAV
jgi:lipopolysaccharide/colanic/teichoic acid biosynthesis glycosyltransferase